MKYLRMVAFVLVMFVAFSVPQDSFAKTKAKSGTTKTFAFISTDGEVCSAKVYSTVGQNYTVSGDYATYGKRTYWIGLSYVATYAKPEIISRTPKYTDSNEKDKKTFSWKNDTGAKIIPSDVKSSISRKNTTSVKYKKSNKNYFYLGYTVGNMDYMVSPIRGYHFKMALKVS